MANSNQDEFNLPAGNNTDRSSSNFLPKYFRTDINKKFISSTIDQMLAPGVVEKLNVFAGRRHSKTRSVDDSYLEDVSADRSNYQFEPVAVYKDELNNVNFLKNYNDYISQIKNFKGTTSNHSLTNSQEFYTWNPHIDWDKFTNFREYYWLPMGPDSITVYGTSRSVVSTYSISLVYDIATPSYIFTETDYPTTGIERNPIIKLYRGQRYKFEINTVGHPIAITSNREFNTTNFYNTGVSKETVYVEDGVIEFTVPDNAPDTLYYVSQNDINVSGIFSINDITENTELDINSDILGKKTYKTSNGTELSNGMKLKFIGTVIPDTYAEGYWYVEGVGNSIVLVSEKNLEVPSIFTSEYKIPFDGGDEAFDQYPFEDGTSFPGTKDYIVINRASADRNPWSRYNRWCHRSIIEQVAYINNQPVVLDQTQRAKRPIIEFEAGLKLFQHGTKCKVNVDLVDTYTTDVFSNIEGSIGYNVDGINLVDGMRILFTADKDILVANNIYEVNFITHNGRRQISLIATTDSSPVINETVLVLQGTEYKGKMFYYNGTLWNPSQEKTAVNQAPLFDMFDKDGNSFNDSITYPYSTFAGNKLFSYQVGTSTADSELGFSLSYRNINNIGDILFDFNILDSSFIYQDTAQESITVYTDTGFLKSYNNIGDQSIYVNGWKKAIANSKQPVIRQYVSEPGPYKVDVFTVSSGLLTDLVVRVYLDGVKKEENVHYTLSTRNNIKIVTFLPTISTANSSVVLKCYSNANKNSNGFYEMPINFEKNPLNENLLTFTLGEVNDHVSSIVQDVPGFSGDILGVNNLRDLGNVTEHGKRFVQHSGPLNLALYHVTDKDANIIKSLKFARKEYAKFKRQFINEFEYTGFHGGTKEHVDLILSTITKDKTSSMPFYFSDMLGVGANTKTIHTVEYDGPSYFALSLDFDLLTLSTKSVLVYKNDVQLVHGDDYNFTDRFVYVLDLVYGDTVTVYEYQSTNGTYIPPTPTKLGLYPKYLPMKFTDNSYSTPKNVIQGHDGSIILAFDDYRDDLILELETRIYNNIKIEYNTSLLDVHSFVGGAFRNTNFDTVDINNAMLADFAQWIEIAGSPDYSSNTFYDSQDSFTYNYYSMTDYNDNEISGYWRSIFKKYFDTDRPHTHPWEMLGFTIKPTWWEAQYGPAPYTSDNLILWNDLQDGIIKVPNAAIIRDPKYIRPGLLTFIPVDEYGKLLSPLECGLAKNFSISNGQAAFKFGDSSPVETAWRRSSEYPFSLITSWVLLQPAKLLGLGFDLSRIKRDAAGNLVYTETDKRISLSSLKFPTIGIDTNVILTSGLVNYIASYMSGKNASRYTNYITNLKGLNNQLAIKLGGFADKTKLKLLLDSRSPLNKTSVFVPDENYQIAFITSSALEIAVLSGIIIEKTANGYLISGYDKEDPVFLYNVPALTNSDPAITVGGISEKFVTWAENKTYPIGTIVEYNSKYYRTKTTHQSTTEFDSNKFAQIASIPIVGGASAVLKRNFDVQVSRLSYGTLLSSKQDLVDFMLGYEYYLKNQGFKFEYFNTETEAVENMQLCVKEFLFWTTQNWDNGTILTVSPVANQVSFERPYHVVDNLFDGFYDYSLLAGNGQSVSKEFSNIFRNSQNEFGLKPIGMSEGIFLVKLPLVQKEHVILIDNETVFNDVIFDKITGYRQDRIKLVGYRTDNWNGSLNIPGFIYDDAKVTVWSIWTDYSLGDLVKYKEFYYVSTVKHTSNEYFDANHWSILNDRPEPELLPNWDYRVNQFTDFYSLDTDNFDSEQQRLGQHLIGYQKRNYLSNIITDSVSQYKFYQGFIQDKGTKNSLTKLFDALSSANTDSLEFYEEWAIRLGQYGSVENNIEVEFKLDESKYSLEPQLFELVNNTNVNRTDLTYELLQSDAVLLPTDYDHSALFSTTVNKSIFTKNSGYCRNEDVTFVSESEEQLVNLNIDDIQIGDFVWIKNQKQNWNAIRHVSTGYNVESIIARLPDETTFDATDLIGFTVYFDTTVDFVEDELVGLRSRLDGVNGFHKVKSVVGNEVVFITQAEITEPDEGDDSTVINVSRFVKRRFTDINDLNQNIKQVASEFDDTVWIDSGEESFAVFTNNPVFSVQQEIVNPDVTSTGFSTSFDINDSNAVVVVGSIDNSVRIYTRNVEAQEKTLFQTLLVNSTIDVDSKYGFDVAISEDGKYIAVGAPNASNAKTYYAGYVEPDKSYNIGDIVNDRGTLWRALTDIASWGSGDSSTIDINDQDWAPAYLNETSEFGNTDFGYTNQGAVFLYERRIDDNTYELSHCIVSPNPTTDERFGYKVELRKTSTGLTKLFVGAPGEDAVDQGRIYFLDNTDDAWTYTKDRKFKGSYSDYAKYDINDIVFESNVLYKALTNIDAGVSPPTSINTDWQVVTDVEHTGYVPHGDLSIEASEASLFSTATNIGKIFDVNKLADIFVMPASTDQNNAAAHERVTIYRHTDNRWTYSQSIDTDDSLEDFGYVVAIDEVGEKIAIGAPLNDDAGIDQGVVYVYKQVTTDNVSTYTLNQTLKSPFDEPNEAFGTGLDFYGNKLAISGKNTDTKIHTTLDRYTELNYNVVVGKDEDGANIYSVYVFDNTSAESAAPTTFDGNSTKLITTIKDSGRVSIWQEIDDYYIYGEDAAYNRNIKFNDVSNFKLVNNHLYIGLPKVDLNLVGDSSLEDGYNITDNSSVGILADLRSEQNANAWVNIAQQSGKVSIPAIQRCFLYANDTSDLILNLDIIDPRQGKFAGPAEQELSFKTHYDPATYSVNASGTITDITVDSSINWTDKYVGMLWWDMSTASWYNPYQGDIQYRSSVWNKLTVGSTVDVYEWVRSDVSPTEWAALADTTAGISRGISGLPLYDDTIFSFKNTYDVEKNTTVLKYYFWVKNNRILPQNNNNRRLPAQQVAALIEDPAGFGYRFIAPLDKDKFALYNSKGLVEGTNTILHFGFYKDNELQSNTHNEYQLITEGLDTSRVNSEIETKWFDSLIGYDSNNKPVPDTRLTVKQKYGILNVPRQSMFVNRIEALKQFVERVNIVFAENQIVDNYNLTGMLLKDEVPNINVGKYDTTADTVSQLQFLGVAKLSQAVLQPTVVNGKITNVTILNAGRGYKVSPVVTVTDTYGSRAIIKTTINNLGQVTSVNIRSQGKNYSPDTALEVRPFSVLVSSDSEIGNRWAIYSWDSAQQVWFRTSNQAYDTTRYWSYTDWYAEGYASSTEIKHLIDSSYKLYPLNDIIGDIVKIENVGSGGWLLLEKVDDQLTEDYTINYRTVGRQNGTLQLSPYLYTVSTGFDNGIYDTSFYDREPIYELRNIIIALRDDIFISDLAVEYNKLFFAGVRYAFAEQSNIDWIFKTSFVRAKHNLGDFRQELTFQNDNLENYQDYVNEVKPYSTKVREYISSYTYVEPTGSLTTDFDLPPSYNEETNIIETSIATVQDGVVTNILDKYLYSPYDNWVDNNGYHVVSYEVVEGGSGYTSSPAVTVTPSNGATARAYVRKGAVYQVELITRGERFITPPTVTVADPDTNGYTAKVSPVLGNPLVRSAHITIKFDRVSGNYYVTDLKPNVDGYETFVGTGSQRTFNTKWPLDIRTDQYSVYINNTLQLSSTYTVSNSFTTDQEKLYDDESFNYDTLQNTAAGPGTSHLTLGYNVQRGRIRFVKAPAVGAVIKVYYMKDVSFLSAADRINFFYNPTTGMAGKDLAQLMDGVEYSGVKFDSIGFGNEQGFGGLFGAAPWDTFDNTYEDEIFVLDGSTTVFQLSKALEDGVEYNFYLNGVRLDDPEYDLTTVLSNPNAVLETIVGDGVTDTITIDEDLVPTFAGDIVIIRKSTSDGSYTPSSTSYDTALGGGNLAYTTATGLLTEDITVDGDGFVTPTTSKGPEELVPGEIVDTLDIKVYHRDSDGVGVISTTNYVLLDGSTVIFGLPGIAQTTESVIVKLDNVIQDPSRYNLNFENNTLEFADSSISIGSSLAITTIGTNGNNLIETNYFTSDGSTTTFITGAIWTDSLSVFLTVNGIVKTSGVDYNYLVTTTEDNASNRLKIVFEPGILAEGDFFQYSIYSTTVKTYSQVVIDRTFESNGTTDYHTVNPAPFESQPFSHKILVKVNDTILNPGYSTSYTTQSHRTYDIEEWQFEDISLIDEAEVLVFADGVRLTRTEFTWDPINGRITLLRNDVAPQGTKLDIFVIGDAEYYFVDTQIDLQSIDSSEINISSTFNVGDEIVIQSIDSSATSVNAIIKSISQSSVVVRSYRKDIHALFTQYNSTEFNILLLSNSEVNHDAYITDVSYVLSDSVTFAIAPSSGEEVEIYTFSNHDVNQFERITYKVRTVGITNPEDSTGYAPLPIDTFSYIQRNLIVGGYVRLRGTISSAEYAWVSVNGTLLTPHIDYYLLPAGDAIQLVNKPLENDIIDVLQFANAPTTAKFGFRIFKDMLDRTHYKRLNQDKGYALISSLNYYDHKISLESADGLFQPNTSKNIPGVIFIEGERIEYFGISGRDLTQLRRGTLGTGVRNVYAVGTVAYGQGLDETINYSDVILSQTTISDGSSGSYQIAFRDYMASTNVNEIDVFVGGIRLRKTALTVHNPSLDIDRYNSNKGTVTLEPEFTISGNDVLLSTTPDAGIDVKIVRKTGKIWNNGNNSLAQSDNAISRFLRGATISLPK
jgi:hypothetical protein